MERITLPKRCESSEYKPGKKWFNFHGGVYADEFLRPAKAYCLGNRCVHWASGQTLRGSYNEDWHGGPEFGVDLAAAIEWLQEAEYQQNQRESPSSAKQGGEG